jgi:hypothetical protein
MPACRIAIRNKNSERIEYITSSASMVHEGSLVNPFRKYEQGLVLGAGATFGKIAVELRREASNGMSSYAELASKMRRTSLLVSYRFH